MEVLGTYHRALGELIHRFEGTLERFTGDGLMVFFNDPLPCPDAAARAIRMSVEMRERVRALARDWAQDGHQLSLGIGVAQGFATLGRIGFEGRYDYAAIGSVTNLAARLCGEAKPWQVLVTRRVLAAAGDGLEADPLGDLRLRGFSRPFPVFDVLSDEIPSDPDREAT
jgi:class 3 adenylate cyclase